MADGSTALRGHPDHRETGRERKDAVNLKGAPAAALVDWQSGMSLGTADVVRAQLKVVNNLGLEDGVETS